MKTVKLGSVGLGRLGYEHAKNLATLLPGCTLHAVCDVDEDRLRSVAEELNIPRTYTDFAEMCADPELDGVAIVSPSFLHVEQIRIAMEHGKHVFCEKPLGIDVAQCKEAEKVVEAIQSWCSSWASCAASTPPTPRPSAGWTPGRSARWCWSAPIPMTPAAPSNLR